MPIFHVLFVCITNTTHYHKHPNVDFCSRMRDSIEFDIIGLKLCGQVKGVCCIPVWVLYKFPEQWHYPIPMQRCIQGPPSKHLHATTTCSNANYTSSTFHLLQVRNICTNTGWNGIVWQLAHQLFHCCQGLSQYVFLYREKLLCNSFLCITLIIPNLHAFQATGSRMQLRQKSE